MKSQVKVKQQKRIKNIPVLSSPNGTFMNHGVSDNCPKSKVERNSKKRAAKISRRINRSK